MQTAEGRQAANVLQVPDETCSAVETDAVQAADGRKAAIAWQVPYETCPAAETGAAVQTADGRLRGYQQLCRVLLPPSLQPPHGRSTPPALQLPRQLAGLGSQKPEVHGSTWQPAHAAFVPSSPACVARAMLPFRPGLGGRKFPRYRRYS